MGVFFVGFDYFGWFVFDLFDDVFVGVVVDLVVDVGDGFVLVVEW